MCSLQTVVPRAGAPNEEVASLTYGIFGDDTVALAPVAPFRLDGATGRFQDPPPPTGAIVGVFAPLVPQLLPALSLEAQIDSLTAEEGSTGCSGEANENGLGSCYQIYVTFIRDGVPTRFKGVDLVVVRENTEGLYTGAGGVLKRRTPDEVAVQESINTRKGVERCLRNAFGFCRKRNKDKKLTLCGKTNVLICF